jgi:phage tail sheath protein FI
MPQYRSPGVYVEEIDAGPKPIEGVSTSICGAVGMTKRGPTSGKPVLCTSFLDYTRTFGGYWEKPTDQNLFDRWTKQTDGGYWWHFPLAVKAFFDNGGEQIYVKRVFHQDLQTPANSAKPSAAVVGHGLVSRVVQDATSGSTQVKLAHLAGIGAGVTPVTVVNGQTRQPLPGGPFTVETIDSKTNFVTLNTAVTADVNAKRGDFVEVSAITATNTLSFEASSTGVWGDDLTVSVEPMIGNTLSILVEPTLGQNPAAVMTITKVEAGPNANERKLTVDAVAGLPGGDLADGDHIVIDADEYVVSGLDKPNNKFVIAGVPSVGAKARRLRGANSQAHKDTLSVWGASALYVGAIVELIASDLKKEVLTVLEITGPAVKFSSNLAQTYLEGNKLRVIEAQVAVAYRPENTADALDELFEGLSFAPKSANYIVTQINGSSKLVTLPPAQQSIPADLSKLKDFPATEVPNGAKFSGGDDKLKSLSSDDFVGVDGGSGKRTGIQALEDITDISIVVVPGMWSPVIQSALITHCETLKSRFAIVDPQDRLGITEVQEFRNGLPDTKYAALYYPWVVVRDPSISDDVAMAPSGHMAGLYARVDNERGVHKAPANEVIRGIQKLADDVTKREQDLLNPKNINALRYFPGRGNRVWGARVVTSDSSWKYINVRRLFIYVEQSIDYGTQWVVFEPNDEPLWARVRQTIENFLTTVWRSGALQGGKASEAFFVKCDRSTMTQDDIDNGRLICQIGIAPVKPAEFVIFRIQQKTLDQTTA